MENFLNGDLDEMIDSLITADTAEKIKKVVKKNKINSFEIELIKNFISKEFFLNEILKNHFNWVVFWNFWNNNRRNNRSKI